MAIPGYSDWAKDYSEKFGFRSAEDAQMLLSWEALFEAAGHSILELQWATKVIGSGSPPRFRTEHLDAINRAVRQARAEVRAQEIREQELRSAMSTCGACENSGWVLVPHLSCVRDQAWIEGTYGYHATCVVTCSCSIGQRLRDNSLAKAAESPGHRQSRRVATPLSLSEYEAKNPFWIEQLRGRKRQAEEAEAARNKALARDRKFGEMLRAVIDKAKRSVDTNTRAG